MDTSQTISNVKSLALLDALFHHLTLGPKLPQQRDLNHSEVEAGLFQRVLISTKLLRDLPNNQFHELWSNIHHSISTSKSLHTANSRLEKAALSEKLEQLDGEAFIILHIDTHNAGLLIYKSHHQSPDDCIVFEAFEASARNQDVLASENALQWDFPGAAAAVPLSKFRDRDFIANLATFLEQAAIETPKIVAAHVLKAGSSIFEHRDSIDPSIVSSLLMAILQQVGTSVSPVSLRKRVRDDICWNEAKNPWRRLPLWLVIRVGIERYLSIKLRGELGRIEYKFFMTIIFAQLLDDVVNEGHVSIDEISFLKTKLCRRLVKLNADVTRCQDNSVGPRSDYFQSQLIPLVNKVINHASGYVDFVWGQYRQSQIRSISDLPRRAQPEDLILPLRASNQYLTELCTNYKQHHAYTPVRDNNFNLAKAAKAHQSRLANRHIKLAGMEDELQEFCSLANSTSLDVSCKSIFNKITDYMDTALEVYAESTEHKSTMILTVMELWMVLDKKACGLFPLLQRFHPVFYPEIMDCLLLPGYKDMVRVRAIQIYLKYRIRLCGDARQNIFDDLQEGCYAQLHFDESPDAMQMSELLRDIEARSEQRLSSKYQEWDRLNKEYQMLSSRIERSTCLYLSNIRGPTTRRQHDPNCPQCLDRQRLRQMSIRVLESPLPDDTVVAKAVIFELLCPEAFASYRDAVWRIMIRLTLPSFGRSAKPRCHLKEYSQLKKFANSTESSICLASSTKSFLDSHYAVLGFPVDWKGMDGVCRPNGLKLAYYDPISEIWPGRARPNLSFFHHTKLTIPSTSPFTKVPTARNASAGLTSYEIMASQSSCPVGLNAHEFLAFQSLLSTKKLRWPALLTELGSGNLNFSSEAVMLLVSHITHECGPFGDDDDVLRATHPIFRQPSFCKKLLSLAQEKLTNITANWRETYMMDSIVTLSLRVFSLTRGIRLYEWSQKASKLLEQARKVCAGWLILLRQETLDARDAGMASRCQQYALWAALLCKKTFYVYLEGEEYIRHQFPTKTYIVSSITAHDNLVVKIDSLPKSLQTAVAEDFKMSYLLRDVVHQALFEEPEEFRLALKDIWPGSDDDQRRVKDLRAERVFWLSCIITGLSEEEDEGGEGQEDTINFDYVQGILLVNGQPMGKLPKNADNAVLINDLFGNQALQTYPSIRPGMQYVLRIKHDGFEIHVSQDPSNGTIVRAYGYNTVFQLVDSNRFRLDLDDRPTWDLPGPLVADHFHWLNLRTGKLSIIQKRHKWPTQNRLRNAWVLDLQTKECARWKDSSWGHEAGFERVVAVQAPLFRRIARILMGFEDRDNLLVTQPPGKRLQVTLPLRQLLFFVNDSLLLQSPQLQCEIDPNQDAGTWYGFRSMLVCRDLQDPQQRSIMVALGQLHVRRYGCHVALTAARNDPKCSRFTINKTLGRIDCAAEPLLIYTKALLHALTSSVVPDTLTGRTGTEEALRYLASGICQPWSPLDTDCLQILETLAMLTPRRAYYPEDRRMMKTTHWDSRLTITLQNDGFQPIVNQILRISAELSNFYLSLGDQAQQPHQLPDIGPEHLRKRSEWRRQLYQRPLELVRQGQEPTDRIYETRDRCSTSSSRRSHVQEIVHLLEVWPQTLNCVPDLAEKLSQFGVIRGFHEPFEEVSLSNRLNINILQQWGPLVRLCQQEQNRYTLMFLFAPIAFSEGTDVSLICCLLAFSIFAELREIHLPQWDEYVDFRYGQKPGFDYLFKLIKPFQKQPPEDATEIFEHLTSGRQRKKIRVAREAFACEADNKCEALAKLLACQWPCFEPQLQETAESESESPFLHVKGALDVIVREWRRLYQNKELSDHLSTVQSLLEARLSPFKFVPPSLAVWEHYYPCRIRGGELVTLGELVSYAFTQEQAQGPTMAGHSCLVPNHYWHAGNSSTPNGPDVRTRRRNRNSQKNGNGGFTQGSWSESGLATSKVHMPTPRESVTCLAELSGIVAELSNSASDVRRRYAADLASSIDAYRAVTSQEPKSQQVRTKVAAMKHASQVISTAQQDMEIIIFSLKNSMENALATPPSISSDRNNHDNCMVTWLQAGQLWPVLKLSSLLELLSSTHASNVAFGSKMKDAIIRLGLATTRLQWGLRLLYLAKKNDMVKYADEEQNTGHVNWRPEEHPNWLLLEIETNLLIRPDQVNVALATISPASGKNSVLQMNMGQGKTSCIIPMAALSLADGSNLVRVSVPKALLQQTAQLLQSRLGGLLNRSLAHVPFSRRTLTTSQSLETFFNIHKRVWESSGIMLCQPEHSLSFMLSGLQRLLDAKMDEARKMIELHGWLTKVCRDILDESDYTLAVRTQLIYPSGSQMALDGHPHRWQVIEALLSLANMQLDDLSRLHPQSIEVVRRSDEGFPLIFFLRQDVQEELVRRLTNDVLEDSAGVLPLAGMERAERAAIKEFISAPKPREKTMAIIRNLGPDRAHVRRTVFLLRGLLVHRILMMTLKKRWNVHYGLPGENRDPISVPYTAKGVPSALAEWGHPEVAILFTCLSFYYEGLSIKQLRQALESVLKSDDPSTEYDRWTHDNAVFPESLKAWNAINLEDELQLREIWGAARYRIVVIDYFLNNFVFPCHAKQFKVKLQSNGWDIPLLSFKASEVAKRPLNPLSTGFSGTNDNRAMLPLNIKQEDLPELSHTNAEVLTYLLHRRSRGCVPMSRYLGKGQSEVELLRQLKKFGIHVLIDVGAQILEMDNKTLASEWLKVDGSAQGVLYFDKENKPQILDKLNNSTSLLTSQFVDDLSKCLIYLDEAHTRGTDLKLPATAKGALTLGMGQAKDHTVQAAMRLRQLGTTQAVTFFIPPEVHQSIVDLRRKGISDAIDSQDVIHWLLDNTCDGIEQLQPVYYSQGIDYCRRMQAGLDYPDMLNDPSQREKYVEAIKRDEQQSLQQLYEPKTKGKTGPVFEGQDKTLLAFANELDTRRKAFQDTGKAVAGSALCEVEIEREVAFEVESVRQVRKPINYPALTFPGIHRDLTTFAVTGRLPAGFQGFSPMLTSLSKTGLGKKYRVGRAIPRRSALFVSNEFDRTVRLGPDLTNDMFMRPVNWILWSKVTETAVIVIPEEAEIIMPIVLKAAPDGPTHLLTYSAPVARRMYHFDNLNFFNMPPLPADWTCPQWLRLELGVYAGRLYFSWGDYKPLCDFLSIDTEVPAVENDDEKDEEEEAEEEEKGKEKEEEEEAKKKRVEKRQTEPKQAETTQGFVAKPLNFMQEFLAARRRGQDFVHTPMGFIIHGKPLYREHAFFREHATSHDGNQTLSALARPKMRATEDKQEGEAGEDNSGGLDDMGANLAVDSDISDDDIVYEDSELDNE